MSLEALKAKNRAATLFEWNGLTIYLRNKIGARDGLLLVNTIRDKQKAVEAGADDSLETIKFHALIASKAMCDEAGNLLADSDEGRAELEATPYDALIELGDLVMKHSGLAAKEDAKKN